MFNHAWAKKILEIKVSSLIQSQSHWTEEGRNCETLEYASNQQDTYKLGVTGHVFRTSPHTNQKPAGL